MLTTLLGVLFAFSAQGQQPEPPAVLPEDSTDISDLGKIEELKEEKEPEALPPLPEPEPQEGGSMPPLPPPLGTQLKPPKAKSPRLNPVPAASLGVLAAQVPSEEELKSHLERRAQFVRVEDMANADLELLLVRELRRAIGARNVILGSAALIHEANAALKGGLFDRATQLSEAAVALSPSMVAAHWTYVRALWAHDWTRLPRITRAFGGLLGAQLRHFRNLVPLLFSTMVFIGLALLGVLLIFAVLGLFKHLRYLAHDLSSPLPSFMGAGELSLMLLLLILLPFVFGYGLHLSIGLALALIYAYQSTPERRFSIASLLLLGLFPAFIFLASPLILFNGSLTDAMTEAIDETFVSEAEQRLQRYVNAEGRSDHDTAVILAHLKRQRGDLRGAEMEYRRALASQPQNVHARNNLGTILYLLGNKEAARATFQQAGNERAEPLLNLASLYADSGSFDQAKHLLERARQLDPDLTALYTSFDASTPTRQKLLDSRLSQRILWSRLMSFELEPALAVTAQLWSRIGGMSPYWSAPLAALGFILLALFFAKLEPMLSIPCPKCGVPAERSAPAGYCDPCQSVFLKAVAIEPAIRRSKEGQVRSYQRRLRYTERLLSLIAGAGHLFAGRPARGALLLFLLLLPLLCALWPHSVSVHPWRVLTEGKGAMIALSCAGGWAALLLLISVRQSWSR